MSPDTKSLGLSPRMLAQSSPLHCDQAPGIGLKLVTS
jgi:hypothetical protein